MAFHAGWLSSLFLALQPASAENLCERQMQHASTKYDIPIGILYAVGLTETGARTRSSPMR